MLRTISGLSGFNPTPFVLQILPFSNFPLSLTGELVWRYYYDKLEIFPALEPSYYACRRVDDVADGDRDLPPGFENFYEWIAYLRNHINTGGKNIPKAPTADYLLKQAIVRLEREQRPTDNIRGEFNGFLDAMTVEYERRINRSVLSAQELEEVNRNSFGHAHNMALIAIRSRTRAPDVPQLPQLQGRLYAIADLETELRRGICNIPAEVLETSGLGLPALMEQPELVKDNQGIRHWKDAELQWGRFAMDELAKKPLDWITGFYVRFLTLGIEKIY